MFKKIIYIVFAVLLGLLVYLIAFIGIVGNYQLGLIKNAAKNEDFDYLLKFTTYHNPSPVYESDESAAYKLKIYEVYSPKEEDYGYMFVFFGIDKTKITISPAKNETDKSTISFEGGYYKDDELVPYSKPFETPLYLDSYGTYGTIYPFMAYGKEEGFDVFFGEYDEDGTLVTEADCQVLTKITMKDCEGEVFCTIEQPFEIGKLNKDDIKTNGVAGYTEKELKDFNNPKSCIWKEALVVALYAGVAFGIGFVLFKKPKDKYHAGVTNITGSKEDPYNSITKQASEPRVTYKNNSKDAFSKAKEELGYSDEETKEEVIDSSAEEPSMEKDETKKDE